MKKQTRVDCKAMLGLSIENGQWMVSDLDLQHNYELVKENQWYMLKSYKNISNANSKMIETMENVGIRFADVLSYLTK